MPAFVNPDPIHRPTSGLVAPPLWGDTVNDDLNVLHQPATTYATAYRAASYTQVATGLTVVPFDTVLTDPGSNFNLGGHAYVCPVAGLYLITAAVTFTPVAGDRYVLQLAVAANRQMDAQTPDGTGAITLKGAELVVCPALTSVQIEFDSVTATNVVFNTGEVSTRMSVALIAPS